VGIYRAVFACWARLPSRHRGQVALESRVEPWKTICHRDTTRLAQHGVTMHCSILVHKNPMLIASGSAAGKCSQVQHAARDSSAQPSTGAVQGDNRHLPELTDTLCTAHTHHDEPVKLVVGVALSASSRRQRAGDGCAISWSRSSAATTASSSHAMCCRSSHICLSTWAALLVFAANNLQLGAAAATPHHISLDRSLLATIHPNEPPKSVSFDSSLKRGSPDIAADDVRILKAAPGCAVPEQVGVNQGT
jgi:hypothetical protein